MSQQEFIPCSTCGTILTRDHPASPLTCPECAQSNSPADTGELLFPPECPKCARALSGRVAHCASCGFTFRTTKLPVIKRLDLGRIARFLIYLTLWFFIFYAYHFHHEKPFTLRVCLLWTGLLLCAYSVSAVPMTSGGHIQIEWRREFDPEGDTMSTIDLLLLAFGFLMIVASLFDSLTTAYSFFF